MSIEDRKKELEEKLEDGTLTDQENDELESIKTYVGKLNPNDRKLTIKLDASPELEKLRAKANYFEKHASMVFQKARKLGVNCEMPKCEEDLILLAGLVKDKERGQRAGGITPLSGQYDNFGENPLRERSYDSYEAMCIDVQKEIQLGGERGKDAEKILDQLLTKEMRSISRRGTTEKEFHGKVTDFQKVASMKASDEEKELLNAEISKSKGKWRIPK